MNTLFRKTVLLLGILSLGSLHAQLPQPSGGRVVRHEKFPSAFVGARNVDVWLP
ncbi:MAG: hypothetical protein IM548_02265, partial [Chitinophagaceae bacterium]|nr:hypothetical protein [Chitinophagaceae bacterium]